MTKPESQTLKRLGPIPFWRGKEKCTEALKKIYTRAMDFAAARCHASREGRSMV